VIILFGEFSTYVPPEIRGVEVDFRAGVEIRGVELRDQWGRKFLVESFFDSKRPVIIVPMYYDCPVVCSTTLLKTYEALKELGDLKVGRDYRVLVYSFNHKNTVEEAKQKFTSYSHFFGENAVFAIGDSLNVLKLSEILGFKYKKVKEGLYSHPVAIFVATPDGKTSQVIYDFGKINPMDLRLSLLEASKGKIGENRFINEFLMYCFEYDSANKRYELVVWNLVKLFGILSIGIIFALYAYIFFKREKNRQGFMKV